MDKFWYAKFKSNMICLHKLEKYNQWNLSHIIDKEILLKTWPRLTQMVFKNGIDGAVLLEMNHDL